MDDRIERLAAAWMGLPKGWTDESVAKFWESLTGDVKHKVTKCMEKMKSMDDPGAFCASLRDKVEGPGWRKGPRKSAAGEELGSIQQKTMTNAYALVHLAAFQLELISDFMATTLSPEAIEAGRAAKELIEKAQRTLIRGMGREVIGDSRPLRVRVETLLG